MFSLVEQSQEFHERNGESKELIAAIAGRLPASQSGMQFGKNTVLYPAVDGAAPVYWVKQGFLRCERGGHRLFFVEAGDLIGWSSHFLAGLTVVADCPVTLDRYSQSEFLKAVYSDSSLQALWSRFIDCQFGLYSALIGQLTQGEEPAGREYRYYAPGEALIIEETSASEVFTMMFGSADVFVRNVKVGEVRSGEIFGAMAATTNTRRSASVVARTHCVVLVLPKEQFLALIRTHPRTVYNLIEDMARIITTQNEKIVELVDGGKG